MKIFTNCIIVLQFDSLTSFKDKVTWRRKITDNGGVVSYVLSKKASFLVVFNAKSASCSFKIRQSHRHNIPVVGPKYVDQCLTRKRLLDVSTFKLIDENNNERFTRGKIVGEQSAAFKQRKKKRVVVNLGSHPSWVFGDLDAPTFNEDTFELPKWSLLVDKDFKALQVIEVHVSPDALAENKSRLYAQSATVLDKKVTSVEEGIIWYFDTVSAAVSGYEQLYRRYSSSPVNMTVCEPGSVDIANLGSNKFKMVMGKLSLLNEKISNQVATLTEQIWNAALKEVDDLLQVKMQYIKEKQIEDGRLTLARIADKLVSGDEDLGSLYEDFYEAIPYKAEHRSTNWTLKDVVIKQDLCQLLWDILSVSEATDWSTDATVIAKYQALGCHISLVNQSTEEFTKLQEMVVNSLGTGGSVQNIYRVCRTIEEVNFQTDIGEIQMLMHSSLFSNYLGILSCGLILPNVVTDKMGVSRTDAGLLGAGIYFTDSAKKSAQYSTPCVKTGLRLLLLCDVALGQKYQLTEPNIGITSPPENFDSVHGVKMSEDVKSFFQDNEYAIYNPNQQCIKYLVEFTLSGDDVKSHMVTDNLDLVTDIPLVVTSNNRRTDIDISDVRNIPDPLAKVKAGLQGNKKEHVPLKSVHIRAKLMDMISQVVVLQAYRNENKKTIEAKYVFPLDSTAAVCGFEAFINGKHIIGEVKEKAKARKEYREAVSKGHGAYLLEEETPDVFSVSVGNLPPNSDVLIKITYIAELQVEGEAISFSLPAAVAPWLRDGSLAQKTQSTTDSVKVTSNKRCEISLQVAMEMPSDIRKIYSPTHKINCKKTATKAVLTLPKKSSLENGFQLNIYLAEIHVPRMWVEKHPTFNTQACMLTFYPEFESSMELDPEIIILLDLSNSMKSDSEENAKKVALLMLDNLPPASQFNIVTFGSTFKELFPSNQKCSKLSVEIAKKHIQDLHANMGSTDIWSPLHASHILSQSNSHTTNLFVISDGHVTQESEVVMASRKAAQKNRVFALGVGSTASHHLLRNIAAAGGGTYEYYSSDTKSMWQRKLISQIEKATQPGLSNVSVHWLQTNEDAPPPVQAPNQIPCLFSGCRQVVYGFVESTMQATLKAKIGQYDMSTMVSTTDLHVTTGEILHRLTAKAVITDYENGSLDSDKIQHQMLKTERKQYIIDLSKKFSIVTPYTSFVAVEDRTQDSVIVGPVPSISDLVAKETVDILPYMAFDNGEEETEKEPEVHVLELLQRGEVAESFSMVQAEETYTELDSYIPTIVQSPELLEKVYDTLQRFYSQNQAQSIGDIISQIEPAITKKRQKRAKIARKSAPSVFASGSGFTFGDEPIMNIQQEKRQMKAGVARKSAPRSGFTFGDEPMMKTQQEDWMPVPVEMPCLKPPEITINLEEIEKFTKELDSLPELPDDDDLSIIEPSPITKQASYKDRLKRNHSGAIFYPKSRSMAFKRAHSLADEDVNLKPKEQEQGSFNNTPVFPRPSVNFSIASTGNETNELSDNVMKGNGLTTVDEAEITCRTSQLMEPLIEELLDYDGEDKDVMALNEILTGKSLSTEAAKSEGQGMDLCSEEFDMLTAEKIDSFHSTGSDPQPSVGTLFGRYTQGSVSTPFSGSNAMGLVHGTFNTLQGSMVASGSTYQDYSPTSPTYLPTSPTYSPISPAYSTMFPARPLHQIHAKDTNVNFSHPPVPARIDLQDQGQTERGFGTKSRWDQAEHTTNQNVEGPLVHHQAPCMADSKSYSSVGYGAVSYLAQSYTTRDCYDSAKSDFIPQSTPLNLSYSEPRVKSPQLVQASFQSQISQLDIINLQHLEGLPQPCSLQWSGGANSEGEAYRNGSYGRGGMAYNRDVAKGSGADGRGRGYSRDEPYTRGGANNRSVAYSRGKANHRGGGYRGGARGRGGSGTGKTIATKASAKSTSSTETKQKPVSNVSQGKQIACKAARKVANSSDDDDDDDEESEESSVELAESINAGSGSFEPTKKRRRSRSIGKEKSGRERSHSKSRTFERAICIDHQGGKAGRSKKAYNISDSDNDKRRSRSRSRSKSWGKLGEKDYYRRSRSCDGRMERRRSRSISNFRDDMRDRDQTGQRYLFKLGKRSRYRSRSRSRSLSRSRRRSFSRSRSRLVSRSRRRSLSRSRRRSLSRTRRSFSRSRRRSFSRSRRSLSRSRRRSLSRSRRRSLSRSRRSLRRSRRRSLSRSRRRSLSRSRRSLSRSRRRSLSRSRSKSLSRSRTRSLSRSRSRSLSRSRSRSLSRSRSRSLSRSRSRSLSRSRRRPLNRSKSRSVSRSRGRSLSRSRSTSGGRRLRRYSNDLLSASPKRKWKRIRSRSFDRKRFHLRNISEKKRKFKRQNSSSKRTRSLSRGRMEKEKSTVDRQTSPVNRHSSSAITERLPGDTESRSRGNLLSKKRKTVRGSQPRSRIRDDLNQREKRGQSPISVKERNRKEEKSKLLGQATNVKDTVRKTKLVRNPETGKWERKAIDDGKSVSYNESFTAVDNSKTNMSLTTDERDSLWSGVVCGKIKDVELAYLDVVQMLGDGQTYFELTDELCSELALRRDRIVEILEEQGIKSLGEKKVQLMQRVIASVVVVIFVIKVQYQAKYGRSTTLSDTKLSTYMKATTTEGNCTVWLGDEDVEVPNKLSKVMDWLKKQEDVIPPLYKVLELGSSKEEFISSLCLLFRSI